VKPSGLYRLIFLTVLIAYALYCAVFIYKTSFVVEGERHFVLFDDAMISMRYAANLARGYGLVWNPGAERVEGYTNPLWVVYMAFFHLFPIPAAKISLFIQASGALFLIANLFYVRRLAEVLSARLLMGILAVVLAAFYTPLNNWGLLGMEVSLLTLMLSASLWLLLHEQKEGRFTAHAYLILGVSTLVRLDMAVPYLVTLAFFFLTDRSNRRQHLLWGIGVLAVFLLGQSAFRLMYYGELLPNTYYLKMAGYPLDLRVARGLYVLFQFIWKFNWVLFLMPFLALIFRHERHMVLLVLVFVGQVAYSVYVGGDAWEHRGGSNRYISIVMPVWFLLFAYVADSLFGAIINRLEGWPAWRERLANVGLSVFVLASMVNFNLLVDFKSLERWVLLRQPAFVEGNKEDVRIALEVRKITRPQASIAVVTAGAIPYFSDRPAIDLLGKSDAHIARGEVRGAGGLLDLENYRPGHMKWDYAYSIGRLKPDVVVQLWNSPEEAQLYLDQYYVIGGAGGELAFSLRRDSPNILWDKVHLLP